MRVLLINNYHYLRGGSERAYFDTARILEEHGHQVAFFSTANSRNKATPWSKYFVSDIDLSSDLGPIAKAKAFLRLFANPEANRKLKALIAEFKPDVAHLHNIYHHLSPSIVSVLKSAGVPTVMTLHDYQLIAPNRNLLVNGEVWEGSRPHRFYRCLTDRCIDRSFSKSLAATLESYWHHFFNSYSAIDLFVSPSVFLMKKFHEYDFKGKIYYLPNPVFLKDMFSIPTKGAKYILYYGRLSEEKGVLDLLKAYSSLKPDAALHFVGEGPLKEELKRKAKRLGGKVKFFGRLEGENLWNMVGGAEIVVAPSRWYENAPYTVLEPMALGRPVLAADIGGFKELIKDGENGFLFRAGDVDDLAVKLKKALDDEVRLPYIGSQAIRDVKKNNSPKGYYEYLLDIYFKASRGA
jgi:glycosyltransferase involved in cell wall biosynthesis